MFKNQGLQTLVGDHFLNSDLNVVSEEIRSLFLIGVKELKNVFVLQRWIIFHEHQSLGITGVIVTPSPHPSPYF